MLEPTRSCPIFETVREHLAELMDTQELAPIQERALLREEFYVGYLFLCDGWRVAWRGDLGTITFENPKGRVVRTVDAPDTGRPERGSAKAA